MKRKDSKSSRRQFLKNAPIGAALLGGAGCATSRLVLPPTQATPVTATESKQVEAKIPLRPLGRTGVKVSMIGMGGGGSFLSADDRAALLERAIAAGITYFDTASTYGKNRESEIAFGSVLPKYRRDIFLATKTRDRTYDAALRSVEESLTALKTDHLDLIQIHDAQPTDDPIAWEKPDGVLTALRRLKSEKVVRFIGFTGHKNATVHKRLIDALDFDTVLMALNAAEFKPFRELALPAAVAKGFGVIAMKTTKGLVGVGENKATPRDLLAYSWDLPVSTIIVGMNSEKILNENVALAAAYQPKTIDTSRVTARLSRSVTADQLEWALPGYEDSCA